MGAIKLLGSPLYQWETGRQVEIISPPNTRVDKVDFSNPGDREVLSVIPREENGIIVADIPNILLQSGDLIYVYLVYITGEIAETTLDNILTVIRRPKPSDYVYTETEVLNYYSLLARIDEIEERGISEEQVAAAVEDYLKENPAGVNFEADGETLILKDGVLSVNTTNLAEQDNTQPITSAGVYATVGNIEVLLKTI